MSGSSVLVTGGAGFIGSHLVDRLVAEGHRVRVIDNFSTGRRENLAAVLGPIDLVEGDIADAGVCGRAVRGVEYIFHQAALGSVPKSVDDPRTSHDTNLNGTFNLLLAAVDHKVRRFLYAGSSSVYGDSEISPKHERLPSCPMSPYAVQKLTGEFYCRAFFECYGLETMTLRYFNVFGPRQDPNSRYAAVMPAFAMAAFRGEAPVIYGDGHQSRDFTYIDNVVEANLLAMRAAKTRGESVNIACGEELTVNELVAAVNRALGTKVKPRYEGARAGDVRRSCADIGLAKKLLGYVPRVSFAEGLARTIEHYRAKG
ncbi:MAG: SDR family oxidoreductase [Gammaproteobacteria bacterium]